MRDLVQTTMYSMTELPTEIILSIQSYFPLKTLIAARGVCRFWRTLLPGCHLLPPRRRLLELYLHAVYSPAFLATRANVLPRVRPFDRMRFLSALPQPVPDEFACWVLEWPARAALGHAWPGLLQKYPTDAPPALHKDRGLSLLYLNGVHILNSLRLDQNAAGYMEVAMYRASCGRDTEAACALVLDDALVDGWQRSRLLVLRGSWGGKDLAGWVYQVDGVRCKLNEPFVDSWVAFLRRELERQEAWLREHKS